eukprot:COSAG02_NODE_328_length_24547_cov_4.124141_7_plen_954_part_00
MVCGYPQVNSRWLQTPPPPPPPPRQDAVPEPAPEPEAAPKPEQQPEPVPLAQVDGRMWQGSLPMLPDGDVSGEEVEVQVELPRSPIVRTPRRSSPELILIDPDDAVETRGRPDGLGVAGRLPDPELEPEPELDPALAPKPEPRLPGLEPKTPPQPMATPGLAFSTGDTRPTPPRRSARIPGGGHAYASARSPVLSAFSAVTGGISASKTTPPKLSTEAVAAIAASPTRRIRPSPPHNFPVTAVLAAAKLNARVKERRGTAADASRRSGTRTQLFANVAVEATITGGGIEHQQTLRLEGDAVEQLEMALVRMQEAAAEDAKRRQLQRDEGCVADPALRQAMQQDGLTGPEQQALAAEGATDVDLYRLLSDDDLWQGARIDRALRRRERQREQHHEHVLAAETGRMQAELELQLADAVAVREVLTPVLRQMSSRASKATASAIYSIADLCMLDLSIRQNDTLQHAAAAATGTAAASHSLAAVLSIMDHRLLCNLIEGTRCAVLKAELPQLAEMSEGGLKLLVNGSDTSWRHGDARRVRGMSLKACRRLCLARQDEALLSAVIRERIDAVARLSSEPPLKGLSEGGCSALAIAGVQSFADLFRMAYPPSDTSNESCISTWRGSIAMSKLGSLLSTTDLKVLSRALVACGPLRFTRAAAEIEIGDMRPPLVISVQKEPVKGARLVSAARTLASASSIPSMGLLGGTTATHNGDGNGWRSAICCDTPFDVFVGANARRGGGGHYAEFTILGGAVLDDTVKMMVGIARKGTDPTAAYDRDGGTQAGSRSPKDADPFMIRCQDGRLWRGSTSGALHCRHHSSGTGRHGHVTGRAAGFKVGDVVGLLVVSGTMTLYVNGDRVGEVCSGVQGKMCWVVMLLQPGESVQVTRGATLPKSSHSQSAGKNVSHHDDRLRQSRMESARRSSAQQLQTARRSPQRQTRSPLRTPGVSGRTAKLPGLC